MMSLRKDGSSKRSASYLPYDSSNSFVKKMANKVTGLIGWRSQSQSPVISQNYDNVSTISDEDNVSPTPKRIRMQSEEEDTLHRLIPSTSKGPSELCSPIQPMNNINRSAGTSNRNPGFIASTPANLFPSTSGQSHSKHKTQNLDETDPLDENDSTNASQHIVPHVNVLQRHNVTVPEISRDVPSQTSNIDLSKRAGSFSMSTSRKPSFNVDVFSNSNRRLSMSVCENRNVNSLSPFYSARTMYGGASALLPYGNPSLNRLRSASTSKLNLFSPRSQITIQPVSPSPNNCNNDQETMSASARRILDTLEKYCSPVMDAKRIPVSELRKSSVATLTPQSVPSKGVKRKLPSLNQMTPNTTDLLRIKRQEKMQDSVSNARQVVSTVLGSTIAADDSDSSSDSADLDYSILKTDTNVANSRKYVGKTRRKDVNDFDHSTLPPLKLPNAVLKITNLPKFDITDTFTFSKPLLLENLEQNVTEDNGKSIAAGSSTRNDSSSQTSTASVDSNEKNRMSFRQFSESNREEVRTATPGVTPQFSMKSPSSKNDMASPKPPTISSPKSIVPTWTCHVCLLESTGDRCSSCTSKRGENKKLIDPPKPPADKVDSASSKTATSGWGDKFKAASDTWECKECFVRNASADSKCVACTSPKPGTSAPSTAAPSNSNDLWKNVQKPSASSWNFSAPVKVTNNVEQTGPPVQPKFSFGLDKVDKSTSALNTNKSDDSKPLTNISFDVNAVSSTTNVETPVQPTFTFGVHNTSPSTSSNNVSAINSTNSNVLPTSAPTFSFGNSVAKTSPVAAPTTNSETTFSFGNQNAKSTLGVDTTDSKTNNAVTAKNPLTDGSLLKSEAEKQIDSKKSAGVFNDVSSITNNTKNPLLKTFSDTTANTNLFKRPLTNSPFEASSANKENGDDKSISHNLFNSVNSSDGETPPKKKNVLFSSFASPNNTPNIFGSNGFAKPEANSPLTNTTTSPVSSSSVSNIFNSTFPASVPVKPVNDVQAVPSFGMVPNKMESVNTNDAGKGSRLFAGANSFGASLTQPQQTSNETVFGGFGGAKLESQTTNNPAFNTTPVFNFGNTGATASQVNSGNQQPATNTFAFNGPKAEEGSTKFMFGGMTNANSTTSSLLPISTNVAQFTNSNFTANNTLASANTPSFNFNASTSNDQSKNMNSIFAPSNPPLKNFQSNSNSLPTFGNSVFGNTSQSANQTVNATKKGGFTFPSPNQFGSQPVNNFTGFGGATTANQDQNNVNSNAAPGTSPYIFGSANLTVPSRFNFSGGNTAPTFSAQPTAINNTAPSGIQPRRIKKAVRRTAK